jgi:hypothetical protein
VERQLVIDYRSCNTARCDQAHMLIDYVQRAMSKQDL